MDWKGVKTLVTGGAGLIGSHLVDALIERGADVVILDNLEPQTHPFGVPDWINPKATFIKGDTRNYNDWQKALDGVAHVFHQAAFGGFTPELSKYIDANASGTALMFEVIQDNNLPIKKIVAASSQAVYGEGTYRCDVHDIQYPDFLRDPSHMAEAKWELPCGKCGRPMQPVNNAEDKPLFTETIYGISKLAEEKLTIGMGRKLGIPTVALRYAVTYGPRQSIYNPYTGVVSIFSTQLLNDVSPVVYEDGEQTRDFLFVSDNVAANLFVMAHPDACWQAFNVGRGEPVSVNRLVKILADNYGKSHITANLSGEFRPGDVRHFVHDASQLNQLGWHPEVSLEDGLAAYANWIQAQGDVAEYFSKAREKMRTSGIVYREKPECVDL